MTKSILGGVADVNGDPHLPASKEVGKMAAEHGTHRSLDLSGHSQLLSDKPRVLIVGFGKAGERFYRALRFFEERYDALEVAGVCDINSEQLNRMEGNHVARATDLRRALQELAPAIVCVCVNEVGHFSILRTLAEYDSVRAVFSEKPLTESLRQCEEIIPALGDRLVAVNFVERYSPMVDQFLAWRESVEAEVLRAEFFWGKYRFMDSRPTMGVLSEISHPIDLTRYLIGAGVDAEVVVDDVSGTKSQFSVVDRPLIDSVDVGYSLASTVVRGHSSFLWDGRNRRVILYGRQRLSGALFQAVLDFDNPRWDCDSLRVWRMDERSGRRDEILWSQCTTDHFPSELSHVFKVARYCSTALRAMYEPQYQKELVVAEDALWVQRMIETLNSRLEDSRASTF